MSQRRSRLARKASRVVLEEREQQVSVALGKVRAERDKALNDAATEYRKGQEALAKARFEARRDAQEKYDEKRRTILKAFHKAEEEKAA